MNRAAILLFAALFASACSNHEPPKPKCGNDTTIVLSPVGGAGEPREVHLTPVCESEKEKR